jgi:hypothetical protein
MLVPPTSAVRTTGAEDFYSDRGGGANEVVAICDPKRVVTHTIALSRTSSGSCQPNARPAAPMGGAERQVP